MSTATDFFLHLNGVEVACTRVGCGPPLLLIHGAEGSRKSFSALGALLSESFSVISYDQRDCGETKNNAASVTLNMLAADAQALIRELGFRKAHVFGSSFGGRVAQTLALSFPEVVDSLVLGSTWAVDQSLVALNPAVVRRATQLRELLPDSAPELADFFFPSAYLESHPSFRSHFKTAPPRTERTARRAAAVSDASSFDPAGIGMRTLVLAGEFDRLVPPALTLSLANRIANSTLQLLPGVGHISYVQAPDLVATLISEFCGSRRRA